MPSAWRCHLPARRLAFKPHRIEPIEHKASNENAQLISWVWASLSRLLRQAVFFAALTFAHRTRCAAAILLRALADIVRFLGIVTGFAVSPLAFTFAHRALWAAAILALPAADIPPRGAAPFPYADPKAESAAPIAFISLVNRSCSFFNICTTPSRFVIESPSCGFYRSAGKRNGDFASNPWELEARPLHRRAAAKMMRRSHLAGPGPIREVFSFDSSSYLFQTFSTPQLAAFGSVDASRAVVRFLLASYVNPTSLIPIDHDWLLRFQRLPISYSTPQLSGIKADQPTVAAMGQFGKVPPNPRFGNT
jgi:hypothetical protein